MIAKGGDPVALCASCGAIKGSAVCCDASAERCSCGMIKGTPGCCVE